MANPFEEMLGGPLQIFQAFAGQFAGPNHIPEPMLGAQNPFHFLQQQKRSQEMIEAGRMASSAIGEEWIEIAEGLKGDLTDPEKHAIQKRAEMFANFLPYIGNTPAGAFIGATGEMASAWSMAGQMVQAYEGQGMTAAWAGWATEGAVKDLYSNDRRGHGGANAADVGQWLGVTAAEGGGPGIDNLTPQGIGNWWRENMAAGHSAARDLLGTKTAREGYDTLKKYNIGAAGLSVSLQPRGN